MQTILSSSSSSSRSPPPHPRPTIHEYAVFMQTTVLDKEPVLLMGGTVHQRHDWIRRSLQTQQKERPLHVQVLSAHAAAKTSFGAQGDSLFGYLDLDLPLGDPPPLELLATLALHQHKCMAQSENRRVQTRKQPRTARYPQLPSPTQTNKRYPDSLLQRLCDLDVLVLLDFSTWSLPWWDHLDFLCKWARHSKKPFGGLPVLVEGEVFRATPMNEGPKRVYESQTWPFVTVRVFIVKEPHMPSMHSFLEQHIRGPARTSAASYEDFSIPVPPLIDQCHSWPADDIKVSSARTHTLTLTMSKAHAFQSNKALLDRYEPGDWLDACRPRWYHTYSPTLLRRQTSSTKTVLSDGSIIGDRPSFLSNIHQDDQMNMGGYDDGLLSNKERWYSTIQDWLMETYEAQVGSKTCFFGKESMQVRIFTKTQTTPQGQLIPWGIRAEVQLITPEKAVLTLLEGGLEGASRPPLPPGEEVGEEEPDSIDVSLVPEKIHLKHPDFDTLYVYVFPFVAHYATYLYEYQGSSVLGDSTQIVLALGANTPTYPGVLYTLLQLVQSTSQVRIEIAPSKRQAQLAEQGGPFLTYPPALCVLYDILCQQQFTLQHPQQSKERAARWTEMMELEAAELARVQLLATINTRHKRRQELPVDTRKKQKEQDQECMQSFRQRLLRPPSFQ